MPEDWDPSEAIVICTRNRPGELRHTLTGIEDHPPSGDAALVVVDASDPEARTENRRAVDSVQAIPRVHWPYADSPSLPRQRNYALDRLPPSVEIVHFIDDDVTVHAGYFDELSTVLRTHSEVGGVGGVVIDPHSSPPSAHREWMQRLFFLSHAEDGRVLPSGYTTSAQHPTRNKTAGLHETEWLNGCSSYRRSLVDQCRFDEILTGYSMLEDLDLSYRIHQRTRVVVEPEARLTHRRSPRNRFDAERYNHALTVHRRWFVEKHFDDLGPRLAYWWSLVGRFLAIATSSDPNRNAALRGLIRGVKTVLRCDHPLLAS